MNDCVKIWDYTVIAYKFDGKCTCNQYLWLKEPASRSERKPPGVTLMVGAVPPFANEECLERLFANCGKVKNVFFQSQEGTQWEPPKPNKHFPAGLRTWQPPIKTYKIGYIVFTSSKGVAKALMMRHQAERLLSTPAHPVITGLKKMKQERSKMLSVDMDKLEKDCTEYLRQHDIKRDQEKEAALRMEGVPDEDGWVTVTKHSRNKGLSLAAATPGSEARQKATARQKKRKKTKELLDFYKLQMNDAKKQKLDTLQQKFEEKKQLVNQRKAARKFNPY